MPRSKQRSVLVREAWEALLKAKPWLVREALERGLSGGRPLGFLELGARLMKEIGQADEKSQKITIIVKSPLDAGALRPVVATVRELPQSHPELPAAPEAEILEAYGRES